MGPALGWRGTGRGALHVDHSGRDGELGRRRDGGPVRQELARIVEEDDAIAQQAPPLLGVRRHDSGERVVRRSCGRAGRLMRAHGD
jgi:hypothetical protein